MGRDGRRRREGGEAKGERGGNGDAEGRVERGGGGGGEEGAKVVRQREEEAGEKM